METRPAHSVMPRMLRTAMPVACSKRTASSVGKGDPPVYATRMREMSASTGRLHSPARMVGTQASAVTPSRSQNFQ